MDEIFNEKMVKKLPDTREAVLKGVIAVVSIAAMTASIMYAGVMCILVILAVGVGYYFLNKQFEIEYEYILTNDELDVDKIIARERRKHLLSVDIRTFEILAPMKAEYKSEYENPSITNRIDASSSVKSDKRWFAVFRDGEKKTLLIFEPGKKMREGMRHIIPRTIKE
ncbi:MAG: DUF6106 family protein [Clostridiales bacterium]|nr:DUF6106 family protein [Clostridiales bacterium]